MLDIFDKDEKEDLSTQERKALRLLAEELKRQAKADADRRKRGE